MSVSSVGKEANESQIKTDTSNVSVKSKIETMHINRSKFKQQRLKDAGDFVRRYSNRSVLPGEEIDSAIDLMVDMMADYTKIF